MLNNPQYHRQIIMDHYEQPRNKKENPTYPHKRMDSDSCVDDITVFVDVKDGVIEDISFEGVGCTISIASTSIMTELMKGKTISQAQDIMTAYFDMIALETVDAELLREAVVFENVGKQANRIQCATLGWRGLKWILNQKGDNDGKE